MNETIFFRYPSKTLNIIKNTKIFKGEKNVDYFEFLVPSTYNKINIKDCDVTLTYITPDNNEHYLLINDFVQEDLYKDCLSYVVNIDEHFTSIAGEIKMYITITGLYNSKDVVLKSSVVKLFLEEHPSGNNSVTEEQLNIIDEVLLRSNEAIRLAKSVREDADNGNFNGKISPEQEIEIKDEIISGMNDFIQSKINDVDSLTLAKMEDLNNLTTAKISDINSLVQSQTNNINNVVTTSINNANKSISDTAQTQIQGINNVAFGKLTDINNVANNQIDNINKTAQGQANALDVQASEVYKNLNIKPVSIDVLTATKQTIDVSSYKTFQLINLTVDSSTTTVGDNLYLEIITSENSIVLKNINDILDISNYDSIDIIVRFRGGSNYLGNLIYTLSNYKDIDKELDTLSDEINNLKSNLLGINQLIGGDKE